MRHLCFTAALAAAALLGLPPLTASAELTTANADVAALHAAVALADRATRVQAAVLGIETITVVELPTTSPSAAVFALAARYGVTPTDSEQAAIRTLDDLPAATRDALANVVTAYGAFDAAARAGDAGAVFAARTTMLREAVALAEGLGSSRSKSAAPVNLCPALAVDVAGTSDTYTANCALVIDVGGDDTYYNNAGGSNVLGVPLERCADGTTGAGALVDLTGRDRYISGLDCGINGGTTGGAGFLLDAAGDDVYSARAGGINGGSNSGHAFLLDAAGHDSYSAGNFSTNGGAGWGGTGLLLDNGGNDVYSAGSWGTNGGAHQRGTGALVDVSGRDSYTANSFGANGGADPTTIGDGLLLDGSGTGDTYSDNEGGTGTDKSVTPKGGVGAQLDHPVQFPSATPAWVDRTLLQRSIPVTTPEVPAIDADLVRVAGRRSGTDPRNYEVRVWIAGQPAPVNPLTVFTGGLLGLPLDLALIRTPAIPSRAAEIRLTVRHRYDPAQIVCLLGIGGTCVNAPLDPFNVPWLTTSGAHAELAVDIAVVVDGQTVAAQSVRIPFAGQLVAAIS